MLLIMRFGINYWNAAFNPLSVAYGGLITVFIKFTENIDRYVYYG